MTVLADLADRLDAAGRERVAIPQLSRAVALDLGEAYEVQRRLVELG